MFAPIRRLLSQFFSRSSTINNEPLNKVSLIVIIVIDIFILINVFIGLGDISQWHISPSQAYPCYFDWSNYRSQTTDRDYTIVRTSIEVNRFSSLNPSEPQPSVRQTYLDAEEGHLGKVSPTCLQYADYKDTINNSANRQTIQTIDQRQTNISTLEKKNRQIRTQYDSTLLEKIAGQTRERSINWVGAEKAKQALEQNDRQITTLKQEIANLKTTLMAKPESASFLAFLNDESQFSHVESGYRRAAFWYPSIQLAFQALFLLPLILVALSVHRLAHRHGYGLIALMSWHLLVIFFIPLIIKVFEFLQVGVILKFISEIIRTILGGLLFLVSYVYILVIPLVGFGMIKFFQKIVFNPKVQAVSRSQKSRCLKCAKKIRPHDAHCPYCGYYQYVECQNCHTLTYKHLPFCKECGHSQDLSHLR